MIFTFRLSHLNPKHISRFCAPSRMRSSSIIYILALLQQYINPRLNLRPFVLRYAFLFIFTGSIDIWLTRKLLEHVPFIHPVFSFLRCRSLLILIPLSSTPHFSPDFFSFSSSIAHFIDIVVLRSRFWRHNGETN